MLNQSKMKVDLDFFLKRIEDIGWVPNFFCSRAYLEAVRPTIVEREGWLMVFDDDVCMFPPVPVMDKGELDPEPDFTSWPDFIWSDFPGWRAPEGYRAEFLDFQYEYDPMRFRNIEGRLWATFRKNSRKWSQRNNSRLIVKDWWDFPKDKVAEFIGEWMEPREETLQDADVLLEYLSNPIYQARLYCITDERGHIMAIVGADSNWEFVNFRHCIVRDGEPFLDEAVRLVFYREVYPRIDGRLMVNDGGIVDNPNLGWFKDRLNPVRKRQIYSWRRGNE